MRELHLYPRRPCKRLAMSTQRLLLPVLVLALVALVSVHASEEVNSRVKRQKNELKAKYKDGHVDLGYKYKINKNWSVGANVNTKGNWGVSASYRFKRRLLRRFMSPCGMELCYHDPCGSMDCWPGSCVRGCRCTASCSSRPGSGSGSGSGSYSSN